MNSVTLKAFVKEAIALQVGEDTPIDYLPTRAAIMQKLGMQSKSASSNLGHLNEIAGLGTLAVPSIQHLRGKDMSESTKSKMEVGGLGMLAAPYAHDLAKGNKTYAGMASRASKYVPKWLAKAPH